MPLPTSAVVLFTDGASNAGGPGNTGGNLEEAASLFERVLAKHSDSATAAFNLGAVREKQGRYAEAVRWFGKAASLKPGFSQLQ